MLIPPSILNSLSLADLQKASWLLAELEGAGVVGISDAARLIAETVRTEHRATEVKLRYRNRVEARKQKDCREPQQQEKVYPCPHCGHKLGTVKVDYDQARATQAEGLQLMACCPTVGGCGWSGFVKMVSE